MRKLIFLLLLVIAALPMQAKNGATLTANAPEVVVSGDQFRLTFTVNTQKVKDFLAPSIKGFDVLMGPTRSQQSSTQIINGKVSSSSSITYTYILMAGKEGTYTIPAASIEVDGEKVFSNALTIKVLPPDQTAGNSQANQGGGGSSSSRGQIAGSRITDKDLFITATASKTTVYEQEAILLTYKVYTSVNLRQLMEDMPDMKGFQMQEIQLPQQKQYSMEHYNGRNYNTIIWRQYVLFPQQTGKLEIPAVTFDGVVAQQTISDDPFDAFFNGGGYIEVKKKIVAPKVVINVKPLPVKPANFSGGVGEFTMTSSINAKEVKTNDAVTIKLTIKGAGNMKLITSPEVKFPEDFEVYDPKVTNNFDVSRAGLSGTQTIEYLAIPRHAGNFTIPPVEFVYFDLKSQSYKTLKTEAYDLKVEKGKGNADQVIADFTNKENVKVLGQDVRFIKLGDTTLTPKGEVFFGTMGYWLGYLIPFIVFVALVVFFRKQAAENANVAKVKTKKANKVATKRMKLAGKLLAENKKNEFYDEVLKALWGYISDKLSIPVSQLSKDNIEAELTKHGVAEDVTKTFINALNECEFARYAPGDENEAMDKVYATSVDAIGKMENSIKH
ncbi:MULTISPECIES: BatD family protein [Bacteroidaceae]|uniref:BatD family protein n=1 Tax=Bacteroidaceae TaxID=815 RepID=UPI000B38DE6D|nr:MULTISPECIES: BatD family protein [Bacteroides]MBM6658620.1 protein BatD [Bacteroides gallinaceum]MBM6945620.1 protein BatD [Bacteroides gallinaceum]OUO55959.1 BatD protein [Bacteroides sp. An279]OUO76426.1 BatD protein [Bacteroides sp. An269]